MKSKFKDLGYEVDEGTLYYSHLDIAKQAVDKNVDIIVIGINYSRYIFLIPVLKEELRKLNDSNI